MNVSTDFHTCVSVGLRDRAGYVRLETSPVTLDSLGRSIS